MSQKSISVERTLSGGFERLKVAVVGVKVTLGRPHSGVTVCAEPDVVEKISTKVVNGTLVVKPESDSSFSTDVAIQVSFSVDALSEVEASAGARVDVDGLAGDSFKADAASGARITARGSVVSLIGVAKSGGSVDFSEVNASSVSSQCQSGGVVRGR